jgi:cytochrome c oxidase subunit 2
VAGEVRAVSLHYGEPQVAIGIVFAVLTLVFASAFVLIALSSRDDVAYERVQLTGYWLRRRWLALLLVFGVLVLGITFFDLPYASGSGSERTLVKVTGVQFVWSLVPDTVRAGTPVRFDVTSADVNHGFGLYDPSGHLVGSVQAMPGYHNELDLTLHTPGKYRIRCLEFCGLNHAVMESTFTVLPATRSGG